MKADYFLKLTCVLKSSHHFVPMYKLVTFTYFIILTGFAEQFTIHNLTFQSLTSPLQIPLLSHFLCLIRNSSSPCTFFRFLKLCNKQLKNFVSLVILLQFVHSGQSLHLLLIFNFKLKAMSRYYFHFLIKLLF